MSENFLGWTITVLIVLFFVSGALAYHLNHRLNEEEAKNVAVMTELKKLNEQQANNSAAEMERLANRLTMKQEQNNAKSAAMQELEGHSDWASKPVPSDIVRMLRASIASKGSGSGNTNSTN